MEEGKPGRREMLPMGKHYRKEARREGQEGQKEKEIHRDVCGGNPSEKEGKKGICLKKGTICEREGMNDLSGGEKTPEEGVREDIMNSD